MATGSGEHFHRDRAINARLTLPMSKKEAASENNLFYPLTTGKTATFKP